jgi:uncharacterized protein YceK
MKYLCGVAIVFLLTACGTVTTLSNNDQSISGNLKDRKTYCETLPRIYSGVSYVLCTLHSNPNNMYAPGFYGFFLFDIAGSAVGDTLVLPYSMYTQSKYGSIGLRKW